MTFLQKFNRLLQITALLFLVGFGNPAWAANYSLDFTANTDQVTTADHTSLDITGDISIQAWVNPDALSGSKIIVAKTDGVNESDWSYGLRINLDDELKFEVADGTNSTWCRTGGGAGSLANNVLSTGGGWHHIVAYRDDQELGIYVNNTLVCQNTSAFATSNVTLKNSSSGISIGRFPGLTTQTFDGQIDDVAIWNIALNSTNVGTLYNSKTPISPSDASLTSGLAAYYSMNSNSGTGASLTDDSSNSNTGTLSGANWSEFSTTQSTSSISITEGGSVGTYTLVLDQQPTSDVTVTLSSNDTGAATATNSVGGGSTLIFTASNWSTAQTVNVTPVDDADTNNESVTISHSLSGGGYTGASITDVTVTVADDDSQTIACSGTETITSASAVRYDASAGTCTISDTTTTLTGDDDITFYVPGSGSTVNVYFGTGSGSNQTDHTGCQLGSTTIAAGQTCRKTDTGQNSNWQSTVNRTNAGGREVVLSMTLATAGNPITSYDITAASIEIGDTSPTLYSSTPADGATDVAVDANIVLTFSEPVDTETGNIVLKKSSDNSTVETFDVSSSGLVTGSGTANITINPTSDLDNSTGYYLTIASTAFDDADSNSYAGISDSTTLNFTTVAAADATAPTLSSSTPADGATGIAVDADIVLTFSEAVDAETGNIVLKKSSDDSTVETFDVASSGLISGSGTTEITINPTSNLNDSTGYYITIATTAFDDAAGNSYAGISDNTTLNFTTETSALPTPLGKQDVTASVESWTNTSLRWAKDNTKAIEDRLSWLNRNHGSVNTSHQGIKLTFNNKIIDAVVNTSPESKEAIIGKLSKHVDSAQQAISLLSNTENALLAKSNEITSDAQMVAINEAARLREEVIGSLNPSFKPVYEDWSMWTSGQITVGEVDAATSSSKQDSKDVAISLGFDKPLDDGLVGWSLSLGQTKTDIGTSTTEVKSDNYALSGYSVINQDNGNTIESILGLGHLKFDTTRKDGSDTLTGKRDANQVFASITIKNNNATFEQDNWSITPYGKASASYTELDKFSESGANTALTYNKQTVNEAKVYVGADATYLVTLNNGTMTPFAKIEYGRDVSGGSKTTMHYNSESTEYTLNLDKAAEEHWKIGLGADIQTKDGWTGSFGYEREQAINSGHSNSLKLNTKLKF